MFRHLPHPAGFQLCGQRSSLECSGTALGDLGRDFRDFRCGPREAEKLRTIRAQALRNLARRMCSPTRPRFQYCSNPKK